MKKVLSLILATLLVLTSVAAVAEALPSKTAEDMAYVVKTVATSGDGVEIRIIDPTELYEKLLQEAVDAITNGAAPISLFDEETTQKALTDKLGAEAVLELNELWPIYVFGYQEGVHGDLTATFHFPTVYTAEQTLTGVVTLHGGEGVEEVVLDGTLMEDGTVDILFPEELILKMLAADEVMLYMLNTK